MLKHLKLKSEFSRHVLTLMTGTTIAQAIPIAISPILTRLYSPEDFGVFALYMSVASLITVIVTGRYELAIMLPKKESDAMNIVALSFIITTFISLFTLVLVIVFNDAIASLLKSPDIANWLYFIPVTVFLTGIYQSLNYWNNRKKQYVVLAKNKVYQSTTTGVANITMGISGHTYGGLIFGSILGQSVSTVILGSKFMKAERGFLSKVNQGKIVALAKKYKKFPLINSLHAFVNIFKENAVKIFIALKYSQATLGYYFFMLRLMKLPAGLLGSSIAQVFYREGSEQYRKTGNIQKQVLTLIKKLFIIAIVPVSFLFFFAEDLFGFIFGAQWIIAGTYAKAISPYILFHFVASPLGMIPLIVNKQEKAFIWGMAESILFVSIFLLGYSIFNSLETTLYLLSSLMALYFIVYFNWIYQVSGNGAK